MLLENKYIDQLIEIRKQARENKDWKLSDEIRNYLDTKLVFIFDTKDDLGESFQEVFYLPECYFKNKENTMLWAAMSNRQYVEYKIKEEIRIEKLFDSWLYSTQNK